MLKRNLAGFAVAAALVVSSPVSAYQYEIGGNLGKWETDRSDENLFALYGTLYRHGVNDESGPRREAAFLTQASFLKFEFSDLGYGDDSILSGRYLLEAQSKYFIDASLKAGPIDRLEVGGGMYLNKSSTVSAYLVKTEMYSSYWDYSWYSYLTYSYSDYQVFDLNVGFTPELRSQREDVTLLKGAYRGLFDTGNGGTFLAEAELTLGNIRVIGLNGGYYFNRDLGIKGLFTDVDEDNDEYQVFGIQGSFFVQPNAEIYGSYEKEDHDRYEKEIYRIGVNFRL